MALAGRSEDYFPGRSLVLGRKDGLAGDLGEARVRPADVVITMAWGMHARSSPARGTRTGSFTDPAGMAVEDVRPVRDEIERRVLTLLDQLQVPVAAS